MKQTIAIISFSVAMALIVIAQTGCGDKAQAVNNNPGVQKKIDGGKNPKESGVTSALVPE